MTRVRRIAPPAILLGLVILAWQGIASTSVFDNYTLASPTEVIRSFRQDHALLLDDAWVTTTEILLGLGASIVLGFGGAVAMHLVRPLRDAAYPLFVASQAVPYMVLAPILVESEEHVDWLETQLGLIEAVGLQNYLQTQMGEDEGGGH